MNSSPRLDADIVKRAASGQWPAILCAVGGIDAAILDGRHHPCPKCGGHDRFRLIDEDAGAVYCNQCFTEANGDGLAAVEWVRDWSFPEVLQRVADYLHIGPDHVPWKPDPTVTTTATTKEPAPVDSGSLFDQFYLSSDGLQDDLIDIFAASKPPITRDAVKAAGGRAVYWPKGYRGDGRCIAFPAVDDCANVRGFILRRITGDDFPVAGKLQARKTHMLRGSRDGWVVPGGLDRLNAAAIVWKVEGVPDALALFNHLPDDHVVVTNICGAKAVPPFLEPFRGKIVYIVGDADTPGQAGTVKYAKRLRDIAAEVRVIELPYPVTEDSGKDLRDFLNDGGTFADLQRMAEAATPCVDDGRAGDGRVEVVIGTDEHRVIDQTIAALADDDSLYQRGGLLVSILTDADDRDGIQRPASLPRIAALQPATIRERITRACSLLAFNDDRELIPAHPRDWQVRGVACRGTWPGIRQLEGIATVPVMRPDGSILSADGYDPATGLYLASNGLAFTVPDAPTRDDAQEAGLLLMDLFHDFPFEQPHHTAAALAMILTTFARRAFSGPAPLFLIDANVRGSGKSLIADVAGLIAIGDDLPRMTAPSDDDEMRKRITALVMLGAPAVLIDNINLPFGGAAIDAALTATRWQDRILGRSEIGDLPLSMTFIGTGNNVILIGDTSRRVCPIRLNCREERPEEREGFRHANLREHVRQNRAAIVSAALTILRAYHIAGRPQAKLQNWGSFEGWSALVRQAVVWVGLPDPAQGKIELMERSDTQQQALRQLVECWAEVDPDGEGVTAGGLLEMLSRNHDRYEGVREAVLELCGGTTWKLPSVQTVGNKLKNIRGRVVGGKLIDSRKNGKNQQVWRLTTT